LLNVRPRIDPATGNPENNPAPPCSGYRETIMTLQTMERELETLGQEADAIVLFVAALDTCKLQMLGMAVREELVVRYQGKPCDRNKFH